MEYRPWIENHVGVNRFTLNRVGIAVSATEDVHPTGSIASNRPSTKEVLSLIMGPSKPYSYMGFDGNLPSSSYFNPNADDGDIFGGSNPHDDTGKASLDIVYLGWCEGRLAKLYLVCLHAYAIRFTIVGRS